MHYFMCDRIHQSRIILARWAHGLCLHDASGSGICPCRSSCICISLTGPGDLLWSRTFGVSAVVGLLTYQGGVLHARSAWHFQSVSHKEPPGVSSDDRSQLALNRVPVPLPTFKSLFLVF
ncbi:hypothetical protein DL93DRAFT_1698630 [Clavulina sp. PMI_390]|nr:hypothetical protein DL93DRAFT_1698630 [Clavulina sp. PMI_390]